MQRGGHSWFRGLGTLAAVVLAGVLSGACATTVQGTVEDARTACQQGDCKRAVRILHAHLAASEPEAFLLAAQMHVEGKGYPKDVFWAVKTYSGMAADSRVPPAQQAEAVARLKELADAGDAYASYNVALLAGKAPGLTPEAEVRMAYLQKAVDQGSGEAEVALGTAYEQRGDFAKALALYRSADARGGSIGGAYGTAMLLFEGKGAPKDEKEAERILKDAVLRSKANPALPMQTTGRPGLQDYMASAMPFFELVGMEKQAEADYEAGSYGRALLVFKALADEHFNRSAYYVGRMYDLGQGVPENDAEARRWYQLAKKGGNREAEARLAEMAKGAKP